MKKLIALLMMAMTLMIGTVSFAFIPTPVSSDRVSVGGIGPG